MRRCIYWSVPRTGLFERFNLMKRLLVCASLFALVFALPRLAADDAEEPASAKEALQALNDFIGQWKGTGDVERAKTGSKTFWTETVDWAWRFKKDDAWLVLTIKNGKLFKSGEVRYLTDKKKYQLIATDLKDQKLVFEGALTKGQLTLERTDEAKKETQQLSMNVAGDG